MLKIYVAILLMLSSVTLSSFAAITDNTLVYLRNPYHKTYLCRDYNKKTTIKLSDKKTTLEECAWKRITKEIPYGHYTYAYKVPGQDLYLEAPRLTDYAEVILSYSPSYFGKYAISLDNYKYFMLFETNGIKYGYVYAPEKVGYSYIIRTSIVPELIKNRGVLQELTAS